MNTSESVPEVQKIELILSLGSPCTTNFYDDGPRTVLDANRIGESRCPHYVKCHADGLNVQKGWGCVMKTALAVAKSAIQNGTSVHVEMNSEPTATLLQEMNPPQGFVCSSDRRTFFFIPMTRKGASLRWIEKFATRVVEGDKPAESIEAWALPFDEDFAKRPVSQTNAPDDTGIRTEVNTELGSLLYSWCNVHGDGPCGCKKIERGSH